MNKKNKNLKILFLLIIGIIYTFNLDNSFALSKANITVENNKIDINDYLKLNISIETDTGGNIGVDKIKGLEENFDLVGQSQSQSSSSQISIVNGKNQEKTSTIYQIILQLKAKKKGNYEIGPVNITQGTEKLETNILGIEVTGDQLFINNNHLQIPKNNSQNQINKQNNDNEIIDFGKNIDRKEFRKDRDNFFLLIIGIIVLIGLYYILKNNKKSNKENEIHENNNYNLDLIDDNSADNLVYPEIEDENFIKKLEHNLKIKLFKRYNILSLDLENLNNLEEKNNIEKIINLLDRAKYSNNMKNEDKNILLNLIKDL